MAKFLITPTTQNQITVTARLGGNAAGTRANDNDVGKGVKLVGDSNYGLLAAADAIEGVITSVETGIYDGYSLGGVQSKGYIDATAYGSQAAPGTAVALTVGQYVLAAAPAAIQVKETLSTTLRVVSATNQATAATAAFKARVVSLGPVGTGAVGTAIVIELL